MNVRVQCHRQLYDPARALARRLYDIVDLIACIACRLSSCRFYGIQLISSMMHDCLKQKQ